MTNRILVPCIVSLLATWENSAVAQDNPMDVFKPLVGTWATTSESHASVAKPDKSNGRGELAGTMILGGRFFQLDGYATAPLIGRQDFQILMTFDERKRTYRRWVFRSDGVVAESKGLWNAEKKTLTWTTIGLPKNVTFTVTTRITGDGFEETLFGKRADGTVSMDVKMTAKKRP